MRNYANIKTINFNVAEWQYIGVDARLISKLCIFLLITLCILFSRTAGASVSDQDERRIHISLTMFPRILAIDNNFFSRIPRPNKSSCLAFVYHKDLPATKKLGMKLKESIDNIAGLKFDIMAVDVNNKLTNLPDFPNALFLAERLEEKAFSKILKFAQNHHLILFSPFKGDVERGATAGITFSNLVRPYFNIDTLSRSAIDVNQMLIDNSVVYDADVPLTD